MKLLNTVLREILLFLEFKDIVNSNLAFVNKQFFHNIVQDTELLRRMLDIAIPLVKDYARQEQYYASVTSKILRLKHQHLNGDEEFKESNIPFKRLFEFCAKDLAEFMLKINKQEHLKQLVCTQRTTGGAETFDDQCLRAFLETESIYYSNDEDTYTNGVFCVTGIPLEQDLINETKAKELFIKVLNIQYEIGDIKTEEEGKQEDYSRWAKVNEIRVQDLHKNDTECEPAELFNRWYRNRLMYNIRKEEIKEEDCNIEYDISVHQEIMKDSLFYWSQFHVMETRRATCPIETLAIFTHDYPIKTECHPLVHIIKDLYCKSKRELDSPAPRSIFYSGLEVKSTFCDVQSFIQTLDMIAKLGLIPNIIDTQEKSIEFEQDFYSAKFQNTDQESSISTECLEKAISDIDCDNKYMEMLDGLESKDDFFRLRLSAIAFNLDTYTNSHTFSMKEIKFGRFVTVLALDKKVRMLYGGVNIDIGGVLFSGNFLPSMIQPVP
ncbi:unnamed protein product [Moneuplotes crassus]|uniref:F-box domain-containing protein n=1 Tax=Euplotes crassus TaxID=5936 RepID=A0AAD1Y0X7_EUPCR|nr:unnamed protein product [Moneuplotes crassus]